MQNLPVGEDLSTHRALLAGIVDLAARLGPLPTAATALRTRSTAYREILSALATHQQLTFAELAAGQQTREFDPHWLAALARVVALQSLAPEDPRVAAALLERARPGLGPREARWADVLLAQLYLTNEEYESAATLLESRPELEELEWGYLGTDLINPFTSSPFADEKRWWQRFTSLFTSFGYPAPELGHDEGPAFDRVEGPPVARVTEGPLISVVMTTFKPEERDLVTSVESILRQSWQNLELVIVDDHSPEPFVPLLERVALLDHRIRYYRLAQNRGTYLARNAGIRRARGVFVTGQDADDWSHPLRLETQVRPILEGRAVATRVRSVTTDERLVATRPGFTATRPNPSTLLVSRQDAIRVGGFLAARKAADSEFHSRIERVLGQHVETVGEGPLTIVRVRHDSLSRADFLAGWAHPSRRSFVDNYRHWHATTPRDALRSDETAGVTPFPLPRRMEIVAPPPTRVDILWVADFRAGTPYARRFTDELRLLVKEGLNVGVLHLEDARFPSTRKERFGPDVLQLIHERRVVEVLADDAVSSGVAVVRRPWVLATPPALFTVQAERLVVCGAGPLRDTEIADLEVTARRLFGTTPLWSGENSLTHERLRERGMTVTPLPLPDLVETRGAQRGKVEAGATVVLGREMPPLGGAWPANAPAIANAYPTDESMDVRVARFHETAVAPPRLLSRSWTVFPQDAVSLEDYLGSLDYYVVATEDATRGLDETLALEAMAQGCIVIVPEGLGAQLPSAVVSAEPCSVRPTVEAINRNPLRREELIKSARQFVEQEHSATVLTKGIRAVLRGTSAVQRVD